MICYFWSKMTIIYYINEASLIQWVTKEESLKLTDKSFYEVCISTSFILSNKLFLFVSRSKKIAILLCYLLQRMSWICYYGKKTKVFKIIFYSSTTHWFLFHERFHGCGGHVIECFTVGSHTGLGEVCVILSVYLRSSVIFPCSHSLLWE